MIRIIKFLFPFVRKIENERDEAVAVLEKIRSIKNRMNLAKEQELIFSQKGKDLRKVSVIHFSDAHRTWLKDNAEAEQSELNAKKLYRKLNEELINSVK